MGLCQYTRCAVINFAANAMVEPENWQLRSSFNYVHPSRKMEQQVYMVITTFNKRANDFPWLFLKMRKNQSQKFLHFIE
jgi:hypothetical protein